MRLIDADEAYKIITEFYHHRTDMQHTALKEALDKVPTIEAVSVGTLEQFKWERDIAIEQLNEIGKDLGSKMDDVETVRHGKWIYTKAYKDADFGFWICSCCKKPWWFQLNYCGNCGAKMDEVDDG